MFAYISAHLCVKYNKESLIQNLKDEKIINFMENTQVGTFETLFEEISNIKIKNINFEHKNRRDSLRNLRIKTILFVYRETFDFAGDDREVSVFVSKNFVFSVLNLLFCGITVHHSHVSGNIFGYAHDFCNQRVKELYRQPISVFVHNLFRFDFFLS